MKNKLDKFEQDLESKIDLAKPVSKKRKEEIFKLVEQARAAKSSPKIPVTIRIDKALLANIKYQADSIGIGYQTLISLVLREKYNDPIELADSDNYKLVGEIACLAGKLKSNLAHDTTTKIKKSYR
ncbi:PF14384 domain protein [Leptospira santarosai str. CBC379]|uniref:BrnA antitoxin family protein n=1 Tax=Leptospira santarosai TaxID=28183 RepID=UPI0002978B2D|nr:BrnA antitoxin family protein [Leptospira santarosai]EKR89752.1 PF14384 domain protein [Leptospira santarosai str. CBC379]